MAGNITRRTAGNNTGRTGITEAERFALIEEEWQRWAEDDEERRK